MAAVLVKGYKRNSSISVYCKYSYGPIFINVQFLNRMVESFKSGKPDWKYLFKIILNVFTGLTLS